MQAFRKINHVVVVFGEKENRGLETTAMTVTAII